MAINDTDLRRAASKLNSSPVRENRERLFEINALRLLDEGEDVSLGSAAEAVVALTRGRYEE